MKTANLEASVEPRVHPRACRTWNRQGNRGPLVSPTINRVDRFLDSLHERPDTRNGTDPVLRPVKSPQRLPHRPAPVRLPAFSLTCHLFVLPREFPLRSYTRRSLYVLSFSLSLSLSVCLSAGKRWGNFRSPLLPFYLCLLCDSLADWHSLLFETSSNERPFSFSRSVSQMR